MDCLPQLRCASASSD